MLICNYQLLALYMFFLPNVQVYIKSQNLKNPNSYSFILCHPPVRNHKVLCFPLEKCIHTTAEY